MTSHAGSMAPPPERILVLRLGAIGDCLRVLPAVCRLRETFPAAEIDWAAGDLAAPVLEGHPAITRLHVVRRRKMKSGLLAACTELHRVGRELEARRFDVAIDFHTRLTTGYLARASRAPMRIGFDRASGTEANFLFTNCHVSLEDRYENRVTRFGRLLAPLGVDPDLAAAPRGAHVAADERAAAAETHSAAGRPRVAIFAGTSAARAHDRWPLPKWKEVARRLGDRGLSSMVLWGPGDEEAAREIAAGSAAASVAPKTSLRAMMALLGCFDLYVGSNTAALHMAWMQGVASVVLVGGRPHRTDRPLAPVPSVMLSAGGVEPSRKLRGEAARRAVEGIEVEEVVAASLALLAAMDASGGSGRSGGSRLAHRDCLP
jgi:heptosyltransferase I